MFMPKLFETLKKYNKETFICDLISGIVVAIIALPLSIALAIASGVGPTAAFSTIVANIVLNNGIETLVASTIIAGIFLIIFGILKLGKYITKLPSPIVTGFTAGIAVTIAIGQIKEIKK